MWSDFFITVRFFRNRIFCFECGFIACGFRIFEVKLKRFWILAMW